MVNIGRLTAAVGLRGEIRLQLYAGESENLQEGAELYLEESGGQAYRVLALRYQKGRPVVRLEGVADRDAAEALRMKEVYLPEEALKELPEGSFYVRDLIGLSVYDRASETTVGRVAEYIDATAQSVFRVTAEEGKDILIPDVDAFVKEIDPERGVIEVELIPGFLE